MTRHSGGGSGGSSDAWQQNTERCLQRMQRSPLVDSPLSSSSSSSSACSSLPIWLSLTWMCLFYRGGWGGALNTEKESGMPVLQLVRFQEFFFSSCGLCRPCIKRELSTRGRKNGCHCEREVDLTGHAHLAPGAAGSAAWATGLYLPGCEFAVCGTGPPSEPGCPALCRRETRARVCVRVCGRMDDCVWFSLSRNGGCQETGTLLGSSSCRSCCMQPSCGALLASADAQCLRRSGRPVKGAMDDRSWLGHKLANQARGLPSLPASVRAPLDASALA